MVYSHTYKETQPNQQQQQQKSNKQKNPRRESLEIDFSKMLKG